MSAVGTVLVTGGASGLGAAVAEAVREAGGTPVVLDRRPARGTASITRSSTWATRGPPSRRWPGRSTGTAGSTPSSPRRASTGRGSSHQIDREAWEDVVRVNLLGTAAVVRAALPALLEVGGRVVTVASTLGLRALSDATAYCASKFGVVGFTRALAAETAGRVGVTLLVPGGMQTGFFDDRDAQYRPPADARLNAPSDVAAAVLFALTQPPGCEVRELLVAPAEEPSWP